MLEHESNAEEAASVGVSAGSEPSSSCQDEGDEGVVVREALTLVHVQESLVLQTGARRSDIPAIKRLQDATFPIEYREDFYERLFRKGSLALLVFASDELIGVATSRVYETTFAFFEAERIAYLATIAVAERWRSFGLGTLMLQRTQRWALACNCELIRLHVLATNARAVDFYRAHGFDVQERLEHHYEFGGQLHDGLLVEARLRDPAPVGWFGSLLLYVFGKV